MNNLFHIGAALLLTLSATQAAEINIALGKPVSVVAGSPTGSLQTVTDGIFRPENTTYTNGTVSWTGESTLLEVDLGQIYGINGSIVQADNNDTYLLSYSTDGITFSSFWNVPTALNGGGMATRPSIDQTTIQILPAVNARYFEFSATGGDHLYSVSEIQLFEQTTGIPEPATGCIFGLGTIFLGVASLLSRKMRRQLLQTNA